MTARVLVVDNHDSFVHTLIGYLRELGAQVRMVEADAMDARSLSPRDVDGVLVSPGPGAPVDAGASVAVVRVAAWRGEPGGSWAAGGGNRRMRGVRPAGRGSPPAPGPARRSARGRCRR